MGAVTGPDAGGDLLPEDVRSRTERTPKQVMAAAEVAQGMWRLLLADRGPHRVAPLPLGQWRDGVLPEPAARYARQRIDAARQRQEPALDGYVLATFAGALAATGDPDAAALSLLNLACLHVSLGHPEVGLQLVDVADTEDVAEGARAAGQGPIPRSPGTPSTDPTPATHPPITMDLEPR